MNKKNYILALIALFVLAIGFSSCEEEDDYTTDYNTGTPPTVTLTVVADSTNDFGTYINVSTNQDGIIWWAAVPASEEASPEGYEFVLDEIDNYTSGHIEVGASTDSLFHVDLFQGNAYTIYAVATNAAGQSGDVVSSAVTTTDESAPYVAAYSPAFQSAGVEINTETVLTFNEPIKEYVEGKVVELWGYNSSYDEIITSDNIIISGNTVTIKHSTLYPYNDFIIHNIDEGAFLDYSGNGSVAISGFSYYYKTKVNPASLLEDAFENFLGDMECTDYDYADSTTLDYGPYGVTLSADEATEEPYDVIINGFWGYGVDARMTFNEDGTISCPANHIDGLNSTTYGGQVFWVRAYDGVYAPGEVVGHWDWTDYSFNISVEIYGENIGWFAHLWQDYTQPTVKNSKGLKPADYPLNPTPFN